MRYTLMHKEIPVLSMELDEVTGAITGIGEVYAAAHTPIGIRVDCEVDRAGLNHWWLGRSIPASRAGIREALERLGVATTQMLLAKCFGLSLSDQYWVKPEDRSMRWADVNFFQNPFSEDVGNILFGMPAGSGQVNLVSPDNTSDGMLKKRWKILDGRRCLIKSGSAPFHQEPLNEAFASCLMERLGVDHVPYEVTWIQDVPYSVCPDFITADTELVSAHHIRKVLPQDPEDSKYAHFTKCCSHLGIPGMREQTDRMLCVDYLIANEDRHTNNFGAVRNANTLEWIGPAPIFDCGTSLWHDNLFRWGGPELDAFSKPFAETHSAQIQLVSSFEWLDMKTLSGAASDLTQILESAPRYMDTNRIDTIRAAFRQRIHMLDEHITGLAFEIGPQLRLE